MGIMIHLTAKSAKSAKDEITLFSRLSRLHPSACCARQRRGMASMIHSTANHAKNEIALFSCLCSRTAKMGIMIHLTAKSAKYAKDEITLFSRLSRLHHPTQNTSSTPIRVKAVLRHRRSEDFAPFAPFAVCNSGERLHHPTQSTSSTPIRVKAVQKHCRSEDFAPFAVCNSGDTKNAR